MKSTLISDMRIIFESRNAPVDDHIDSRLPWVETKEFFREPQGRPMDDARSELETRAAALAPGQQLRMMLYDHGRAKPPFWPGGCRVREINRTDTAIEVIRDNLTDFITDNPGMDRAIEALLSVGTP